MRGATVTYTLLARFPAPAADVAIADSIPAGTTYVPGSLTLDGIVLSDSDDGDPGGFDGRAIAVRLGDVAAPASHRIVFRVTIN